METSRVRRVALGAGVGARWACKETTKCEDSHFKNRKMAESRFEEKWNRKTFAKRFCIKSFLEWQYKTLSLRKLLPSEGVFAMKDWFCDWKFSIVRPSKQGPPQVYCPPQLTPTSCPCSLRPTRGERIVFWWPNTNTNIIRVPKNDRIRIRILFGFPKLTEYEYEYYSGFQKWPNTNTNIIRLPKNDQIRIRILFGFPKMTEYEYKYYSTL